MEIAGTEGHALSVLDRGRTGLWEGQPRPSGVSGTGPRGRRSHTTRAGHSSWREQLEPDSLARRSDCQSVERAGTGESGEKGDR